MSTVRPSKRGRPARISRQEILKAALKLLERGDGQITMTGLARSLGVAPMTLYGHVQNREDLIEGVSALVLDQLELTIDNDCPWQQQVRQWVIAVRDHLLSYPQVVKLLGRGQLPVAWVRLHCKLIRLLQSAGFDHQALADAARWVPQYTIGVVMLAQARGESANPEVELAQLKTVLPHLDAADREAMKALQPYLRETVKLQDFTIDQVITGLEATLREM